MWTLLGPREPRCPDSRGGIVLQRDRIKYRDYTGCLVHICVGENPLNVNVYIHGHIIRGTTGYVLSDPLSVPIRDITGYVFC